MTDHTHLYHYEHNTRCWCGEYDPDRNVIDLRTFRQSREPRIELPADVEPKGAA